MTWYVRSRLQQQIDPKRVTPFAYRLFSEENLEKVREFSKNFSKVGNSQLISFQNNTTQEKAGQIKLKLSQGETTSIFFSGERDSFYEFCAVITDLCSISAKPMPLPKVGFCLSLSFFLCLSKRIVCIQKLGEFFYGATGIPECQILLNKAPMVDQSTMQRFHIVANFPIHFLYRKQATKAVKPLLGHVLESLSMKSKTNSKISKGK